MLWEAAVICFFSFFRAGELTIPTLSSFNSSNHLSWGDVAVDSEDQPQVLKVHLRKSKVDQLGRGVDAYVGVPPLSSNCSHTVHVYAWPSSRSIFQIQEWQSINQSVFTSRVRAALQALRFPEDTPCIL